MNWSCKLVWPEHGEDGRRFSALFLLVGISEAVIGLAYGLVLRQAEIALALLAMALLTTVWFVFARRQAVAGGLMLFNHGVVLLNMVGVGVVALWTGMGASMAVWWLVWWPMVIVHVCGARAGVLWAGLTVLACALMWANESQGWVQARMEAQDNSLIFLQMAFLLVGGAVGNLVRVAHDRYEREIQRQQQTILEQNRALQERAERLEGTMLALQQSQLDRTRLFAQISHEVRTPLNGLRGFAQLLGQTPLSEQQTRHVGQITVCSDALLHIVNEMLDFSRMEGSSIPLEVRPFDPAQLVQEAVGMVSALAEQKGVSVVCELPQTPLTAAGDPLRIKQVLLNLLGNALKFTAQGAVRVRCSHHALPDGQAWLKLEVEDSGIGIAADALGQLFQPFNQASMRTIGAYGGSGLGLAVCKRLVDMMQGRIGVSSEPGRGSLFWFELPLTGPMAS